MRAARTILRTFLGATLVGGLLPLLAAQPAAAAPGDLDPTFGSGGKVTTPIGSGNDYGLAVAVQSDGKVVVAGHAFNGSNDDFALARYNPNGTVDTTFGSGGKVITPIGTSDDRAMAVAIQPDGKILAAGSTFNGSNDDFALARYSPTGMPDTGFGSGGKVITAVGTSDDDAHAVTILPDGSGRILLAGRSGFDIALTRYLPSGVLDTTFGSAGKVVTTFGDVANAMSVQPDGKIVVAGYVIPTGLYSDFALARYNSIGTLDTSFGSQGTGTVETSIGPQSSKAQAMAIQPDGKIVASGSAFNGSNDDFALVRYTSSGALDSSFGSGGKVTTPIGSGNDFANAVAIQSDGKIVAVGSMDLAPFNRDFAVVRYTTSGALDSSFGNGGKVTTDFSSADDYANGASIQSDGKVVAAGVAANGSTSEFALARYQTDTPALSISDGSLTEGDSDITNMTFTVSVTLAGAKAPSDITVDYQTVSDSATSADFVPIGGTLTFSRAQTSKEIAVPIKGDLIDEPDETFLVRLSNATGAVLQDSTGTGTILDNDPTPGIYVSDASVTEGNSGTAGLTFTLSLTNPSSDYVSVDFATSDGTATASSGDYQARSGTKWFSPGQNIKTVTVLVNGDTAQENDETMVLNLLDASNATIVDGQGVGTILDDDRPTISINDVSKSEPGSGSTTTITFTVTLSHAGTNTITVAYATADGTAVAPSDYTAKSGTLSFAPGTVSKTIAVTIKHDTETGNEYFYVNLSNPTNAIIADGQGVGTIIG